MAIFSISDVVILYSGLGVFLLVMFATFQIRIIWRWQSNRRIPRSQLPDDRRSLGSMYEIVRSELLRAKDVRVEPRSKVNFGWGKPGTDQANVHFKTSIAKSYLILEKAAVRFDSSFYRRKSQNVREYIMWLQDVCGLSKRLCEEYSVAYEKARFTDLEFSFEEYGTPMSLILAEFMKHFFLLIQPFEVVQ